MPKNSEDTMEKFSIHWTQRAKGLIASRADLDLGSLLWADGKRSLEILDNEKVQRDLVGGRELHQLSWKPQDDILEKALLTVYDALLEYLKEGQPSNL